MTLVGRGDPMRVKAAVIYGDLFGLLGAPPALGRTFQVEPNRTEGRLVVISNGLWRTRFGSNPEIVGAALTLSGKSYTVVGVMPQRFQFPVAADAVDVWASFGSDQFAGPTQNRGARLLNVIGRLQPGVAFEPAQAELGRIASSLREQFPRTNANIGVRIVPAREEVVQDARLALLAELPRADAIGIDTRVLGFTLLATLVTGLLFGASPAWHGSRTNVLRALRDSGTTHSDGAGRRRLLRVLVVSEIALALILLTGAALLMDSFWRLRLVDPGIDPPGVLAFRVSLPYEKYNPVQAGEFFRQLQGTLEALPGVRAASAVLPLPIDRDPVFDSLAVYANIEGRPVPRNERPLVDGFTVQPHYLRVVGVELRSGRDFDARDVAVAPRVAIISETLARRFFPGPPLAYPNR